jgi:hypothetical protein
VQKRKHSHAGAILVESKVRGQDAIDVVIERRKRRTSTGGTTRALCCADYAIQATRSPAPWVCGDPEIAGW